MSIGKQTATYKETSINLKGIIEGLVVSMDPSIGSSSSMPGYAVYRAGVLVASGTLQIDPRGTIPDRLRTLANHMRKLYNEYPPDVLIYEQIPAQRHGGGDAGAHASLLKALGVILSIPGPEGYVSIYPVSWKKLVRPTYSKGDEQDAIEIGHVVIELARSIESVYQKANCLQQSGGKHASKSKKNK